MSDDDNSPPDLEEALTAIEAASNQRQRAFEGVKDASQAIDGARNDVHQLETVIGDIYGLVDEAEGLVQSLSGSNGYSSDGIEVAWDETAEPYDLLDDDMPVELRIAQDVIKAHIDAADSEDVSGEFVTDSGERFEVTFERVDSGDETDSDEETDTDTDTDSDSDSESDDPENIGELFG